MYLKQKRLISLGMAIIGMGMIIALSFLITRSSAPIVLLPLTGDDQINKLITYQLVTLVVVAVMVLVTARLMPGNFTKFFRLGDMAAPAEPSRILGIGGRESWKKIGITFSIIISLVIAVVVLLPALSTVGFSLSLPIIGLALLLAASNAFVEEYVTRFQVIVSLAGSLSPGRIALISAALFGIPHYIGNPGGVLGVLLAGFLGWLLAKSVLETKGLGWAVFIHFLQDVIIFTAILGLI